jgi:hypothetical protein
MEVLILLSLLVFLIVGFVLTGKKSDINYKIVDPVILKVLVPSSNDKKPQSTEQLLQSIHGLINSKKMGKDIISFEIFANTTLISFNVVVEKKDKLYVENQIYAQFPEAQVHQIQDHVKHFSSKTIVKEVILQKDYYFPIRSYATFDVDPLSSIVSTLYQIENNTQVIIQLNTRPIDNSWKKTLLTFIESEKTLGKEVGELEKKASKLGFEFSYRIAVDSPDAKYASTLISKIFSTLQNFNSPNQNSFVIKKEVKGWLPLFNKKFEADLQSLKDRAMDKDEKKKVLSIEELASIYHLPNEAVKTPNIEWAKSRKLEFPLNLSMLSSNEQHKTGTRIFGLTDYRNIHIPFGIKTEDRRRHMYLVGKTGSGKSSFFLRTMIAGDIIDGNGICVIDPHGDLVEEALNLIPPERMKDVIYLDPSDIQHPISLNILDSMTGESVDLIADGVVSVFKRFFGDSWGPRLQYILTNTVLTLLQCQNVSLLAVQRMLMDTNYRKFLVKQIDDPFLLKFWNEEYAKIAKNEKMLAEVISPIQNKVGRFLGPEIIRNMVGQVTNSLNFRDIMDSKKILLVNLSQGKIGEENSALLGSLLVTRLYTTAMQRANVAQTERPDFYLYVDEFQNFATDTFIKILSEARKYGLNLVVTHQYIDQISPEIQNAIFGNVGTLLNFVVGQQDANRLEREYDPFIKAEDLVNLERFRFVIKMTIDGAQSQPFTGIGIRPNFKEYNLKEEIKAASREAYSKERENVAGKIKKWANQEYDDKGNLISK